MGRNTGRVYQIVAAATATATATTVAAAAAPAARAKAQPAAKTLATLRGGKKTAMQQENRTSDKRGGEMAQEEGNGERESCIKQESRELEEVELLESQFTAGDAREQPS
ncbi:hypothetical protein DACRYDRAFT_108158 [Dacryopinax primogenitus]|uniref:Uncharacterized protein n=1 Tax=Dacryopinax primogenitus (strain DJM 731) TaxID=1858805 RepID=M5FYN3_DACPD|nr:uncharacterized protein DACRYDRAFT_108158 [Dacryopinax primogenitus]EJU01624.1 hypothetical protein DACRYDRAFT_108158 [Dacryopinax primogenitus]